MSTITISLPEQVARRIDIEASNQGFATRSEFNEKPRAYAAWYLT